MNVTDATLHFPVTHKIMELSPSFPPADALIEQLSKIEYKKHLNNLITVILTIGAFFYVLLQKILEWYQNGGKETIIENAQKVANFLYVCYLWIRLEGYPRMVKLIQNVKQTYQDYRDLVTV